MTSRKRVELKRIADALERMAPKEMQLPDFSAPAYIWRSEFNELEAVNAVFHVPLHQLVGIDSAKEQLLANTLSFARGHRANNALLWGARGMGKSSLIKAVFEEVRSKHQLNLIEIAREDLKDLSALMRLLRGAQTRIILFCDDLSFEFDELAYKSLKAVLDGGISGTPHQVLFYASSNRRHLMARDMIENERQTEIHDGESVEEKISLSDRFGIWLGFYPASQYEYLMMVRGYLTEVDPNIHDEEWQAAALEWAITRGNRSGRVAWQFVIDYLAKREK